MTNGLARNVRLAKLTLLLRRAAPGNLPGAGRRSGLVIQALRYLKGSPDVDKHIGRLRRDLDAQTKWDLAALGSKLAAWMHPIVHQITQA